MNAAQVRAKARRAMKRREDEVEQEEIEGGEINLIPYLDIVTNLMLFLLASVAAGLLLGQLNTTLPDKGPPQAAQAQTDPDSKETPLKLVVTVTKAQILVWSISGKEGTLKEPKARIPATGPVTDAAGKNPIAGYDYAQLNQVLQEIAGRNWRGQKRAMPTFQALLMADGDIAYGTVIAVMDAMRCPLPAPGELVESCLFPSDQEAITSAADPVNEVSRLYDPKRVDYDPAEHALFHDILFSTGFE